MSLPLWVAATSGFSPYEDFTTYTEHDEAYRLTVTSSKITAASWNSWLEYGWVNKDFGAAYFDGDFTHQFEAEWTGYTGDDTLIGCWMLSNDDGDVYDLISADKSFVWIYGRQTDTNVITIHVEVIEGGDSVSADTSINLSFNTLYYITVTRDHDGGTNEKGLYTVTIRTTSHSGDVVDTITAEADAEQNSFRYVYGIVSYDFGSGVSRTISGYVQNLNLNEGAPSGNSHWYFENMRKVG
jgi:hypothetical protein